MFVLVPLGSDHTVRRWPWFTIAVIAICLLVQIHEQIVEPSEARLEAAAEQVYDVSQEIMARADQLPATERAQWLAGFDTGSVAPADQALYDQLHDAADGMKRLTAKTFVTQWAYHPGQSSWLNMLLCAFVHGGWLHLIGNMLFLWLVGCNLEDRWGHVPFALLYLAGAFASVAAYSFHHTVTPMGLVGASGAIAAAMGAFAVTHAHSSIRIAYLIWVMRIRSGTFWVRALYALPIWFMLQLWLAFRESDTTPVAYSAHVGGFVFGALVAGALKLSGLEGQYLIPAGNKGLDWEEDREFLEANQLIIAKRFADARPLLLNVLVRKPDHAAAREASIRLAAALGDRAALEPVLAGELERLSRDRRYADVHELFVLTDQALPGFPLPDRALAHVIRAACEHKDIACVEHAMRRLVKEHRDSPLIPKALYETAQAQAAAGMSDSARQTLRDLVTRYPMDPVADLAKRNLA
jgi:membrane associated rhomboid family serine protease